jgi:hypothetical protein
MVLIQVCITAVTTMLAVLIGGWLTVRAQDRLWRRDQARQWRDIRLRAYTEFVDAFREYVAYVLNPSTVITAVPRQRPPGDLMPYFDEAGTRYKEHLESTKTALRLVAAQQAVVNSSSTLVQRARALAASRAQLSVDALPAEQFDSLWAAEREFIFAVRDELGLVDELALPPNAPVTTSPDRIRRQHAEQTRPGVRV